jgi:hypothetical protein
MNSKPRSFLITLTFLAVFSGCDQGGKALLEEKNEAAFRQEATTTIQRYVNSQYTYLTGGKREPQWTPMHSSGSSNDSSRAIIDRYTAELMESKLAYTAFTSRIVIDSLRIQADSAYVFASDFISLTTNDKDPEDTSKFIVTEGVYQYEVTLVREGDSLRIRNFHSLDESRFHLYHTRKSAKIVFEPSTSSTTAKSYTYNRTAARDYAYAHYQSGNPDYCDFTNPNGDCTNFLSQCLYTGGWAQNDDWRSKVKADCPQCRNTTCDAAECFRCKWTVAQDFKYYVTHEGAGRIESGNYNDVDLEIGDILQFDWTNDGNIDHSSIVTKKTASAVYVTYRNYVGGQPFKDQISNSLRGEHYGWLVKDKAN